MSLYYSYRDAAVCAALQQVAVGTCTQEIMVFVPSPKQADERQLVTIYYHTRTALNLKQQLEATDRYGDYLFVRFTNVDNFILDRIAAETIKNAGPVRTLELHNLVDEPMPATRTR